MMEERKSYIRTRAYINILRYHFPREAKSFLPLIQDMLSNAYNRGYEDARIDRINEDIDKIRQIQGKGHRSNAKEELK